MTAEDYSKLADECALDDAKREAAIYAETEAGKMRLLKLRSDLTIASGRLEVISDELTERRRRYDAEIEAIEKRWREENAELILTATKAQTAVTEADNVLRTAIVAQHELTGETQVCPEAKLWVAVRKKYHIKDHKRMAEWADEHLEFNISLTSRRLSNSPKSIRSANDSR